MKILVAMSGGVDSSVTARLLTEAGHTCIGCTMKLYDNEDIGIPRFHTCCSLSDVEDARSVAYQLGMRYYVLISLLTAIDTAVHQIPLLIATGI